MSKSKETELMQHFKSLDLLDVYEKQQFVDPLYEKIIFIDDLLKNVDDKSLSFTSKISNSSDLIVIADAEIIAENAIFIGDMYRWKIKLSSKNALNQDLFVSLEDYYDFWLIDGKRKQIVRFDREEIELEYDIEATKFGMASLPKIKLEALRGETVPQLIISYKRTVKVERKQRVTSSWYFGSFLSDSKSEDIIFEDDRKSIATLNE